MSEVSSATPLFYFRDVNNFKKNRHHFMISYYPIVFVMIHILNILRQVNRFEDVLSFFFMECKSPKGIHIYKNLSQ